MLLLIVFNFCQFKGSDACEWDFAQFSVGKLINKEVLNVYKRLP